MSLVAILDADKEGYLRSYRALIQTAGRAARNLEGRVIFYGDVVTDSMKQAIEETNRRRGIQAEYNRVHGITPVGITKGIPSLEYAVADMDYVRLDLAADSVEPVREHRINRSAYQTAGVRNESGRQRVGF